MINTFVYIGDNAVCTQNEKVLGPIYSGGFFQFDEPHLGKYVCLRREDASITSDKNFLLYEVRLFQTPNLLEFVQSVSGPTEDDDELKIQNLV